MSEPLAVRDEWGMTGRQDLYEHLAGYHHVDAAGWGQSEAERWHRDDHVMWEHSDAARPEFKTHVHPGGMPGRWE